MLALLRVILIVFPIVTGSTQLVFAVSEVPKIESYPAQILFKVPDYHASSIPSYSLELRSTDNIENISSVVSLLKPLEDGKIWIPSDQVKVKPSAFSISKGVPRMVNITFNLPNQTATYVGMLTFAAHDGYLKRIPIEISVYESSSFFSLAAVAVGVIIAFLIKYTKLRMTTRAVVMESIDRSRSAFFKALSERSGWGEVRY
jgi:hypothetical protein